MTVLDWREHELSSVCETIEARANGATNAIRPLTHPLATNEKGASVSVPETCISPVCDRRRVSAAGMCVEHARRARATGDPKLDVPIGRHAVERFWRKVTKGDGCWTHEGHRDAGGYSKVRLRGKWTSAHRAAYELTYGPVPDGLVLDHFVCSNPPCCNPDHVRPVTVRENTLRADSVSALNLAKTHCKHGHEFAGGNLRFKRDGSRYCGKCYARCCAEYRARRAAKS